MRNKNGKLLRICFEKIIKGDYVYVDKTALIYKMVTEGNIYFLPSAPVR